MDPAWPNMASRLQLGPRPIGLDCQAEAWGPEYLSFSKADTLELVVHGAEDEKWVARSERGRHVSEGLRPKLE